MFREVVWHPSSLLAGASRLTDRLFSLLNKQVRGRLIIERPTATAPSPSHRRGRGRSLSHEGRGGTAAVEMAIVFPVLTLLAIATADYGRAAFAAIALSNAVGAGAGYAATHRVTPISQAAWEARIHERILDELQNVKDFDAESLSVTIDTLEVSDDEFHVTISATSPFETAVSWIGLPTTLWLKQTVTVRQYR